MHMSMDNGSTYSGLRCVLFTNPSSYPATQNASLVSQSVSQQNNEVNYSGDIFGL